MMILIFCKSMNQKMFYGASSIIFENAKKLRNTVTDAEKILWEHLKEKKLGVKFRRQHPISSLLLISIVLRKN